MAFDGGEVPVDFREVYGLVVIDGQEYRLMFRAILRRTPEAREKCIAITGFARETELGYAATICYSQGREVVQPVTFVRNAGKLVLM